MPTAATAQTLVPQIKNRRLISLPPPLAACSSLYAEQPIAAGYVDKNPHFRRFSTRSLETQSNGSCAYLAAQGPIRAYFSFQPPQTGPAPGTGTRKVRLQ